MCRRHVFNIQRDIGMPRLFTRLQLVRRELNLHLQDRLLGAYRRQLHSVRGRNVQGVDGISRMQRMQRKHVFNSCRGIDMPRLFARLQLS